MNRKLISISVFMGQALSSLGGVKVFAAPQPITPPEITPRTTGTLDDIINLIKQIGGWLLLAAGAIAVVFLIIGGIQYMTSAGNAEKAAAAKKTIIYALIGVVVIAASYFLITVVLDLIGA